MELRTTGEVIGDCGITRQPVGDREVLEVGYHLVRREWGRGLATEAARGCVSWAFDHTGTDDVYAIVRDTNLASMNVAIRLGRPVRTREVRHYRGVEMPHLVFAITRRDMGRFLRPKLWADKLGHRNRPRVPEPESRNRRPVRLRSVARR